MKRKVISFFVECIYLPLCCRNSRRGRRRTPSSHHFLIIAKKDNMRMSQLVGHGRAQTQTSIDRHACTVIIILVGRGCILYGSSYPFFLWLTGLCHEIFYFGFFSSISFARYPVSKSPVANKQLFKHIFLTISGLDTTGLAVGYTLNFWNPGRGKMIH